MPKETSVNEARELLAKTRNIAVLTGAGVSAESGVPAFRGAAGLWNQECYRNPRKHLDYPAAGLAPLARRAGAKVIEVNLEATPLSQEVDFAFTGSSGVILPQLVDR